jgi:CSLREA domain-containing protein
MNRQFLSLKRRLEVLIARLFIVIAFSTSSYTALPIQQQAQPPVLIIEAPGQVEVGERMEIQLVIDHAKDLAGYEAQLLFDTSAAHFSGLHQRDSDLKKFGRDVIPLEVPELLDGVAMGLASCPYPDCVEMKGNPQPRGANGRVRLATVLIGTDQEGRLELSFEHLRFVDSSGNVIAVDVPQTRIEVQVGADNGTRFPAPASGWDLSASPGPASNLDITGDGVVNYADAMEGAFEWQLGREQGQLCGLTNDLSRDVNGDSCIDVVDIQLILANTSGARRRAQAADPSYPNPNEPQSTADADVQAAAALTFTVNSSSDAVDSNIGNGVCASSSGCTLRAAIAEANSHFGPDTILFDIPGTGVQTIQLNSRLPSLSDGSGGTIIDGYSQPGAQPNTNNVVSNATIMIQIRGNGPSAFDAMLIQSAGNRVQGLAIFNARRSILISGSGARNNLILGNFLGTNAAGTFGYAQSAIDANGVHISIGAADNQVGGTSPAERNVISGNALDGIAFYSEGTDNNEIINNLIGLAPGGTQRLSNLKHGIDMNSGASNNIIGGTTADERNIISGNGQLGVTDFVAGVEISHDTLTTNNQIIGNCFGTDPTCNTGPSWAANSSYGIRVQDGVNNNTIAGNVIGNNLRGGIRVTGSGTTRNQIYNNRIGISLNNTAIPNGNFGIQIGAASRSNQIGPNNIVANNLRGVELLDANTDRHTITQNSIFNNSSLGIDLKPVSGVTSNDSGDVDTGPNEELNWPVLNTATTTQVTGTACTEAAVSKPCTIEIFIAERKTSDAGAGNYGQGKTFVGSGTTASNGSFAIAISGVTAGQYVTATATDANGNTSEFSSNMQVSGGTSPTTIASDSFTRSIVDGWGSAAIGGNYTLTGSAADFDVTGSTGTMRIPQADIARTAILGNVSAQDLKVTFRVQTDKVASGNSEYAYFIARRVSSNSEYRIRIRFSTSQTISLRAERLNNGTKTELGTEMTVSGLTHTANSFIWVRAEVVGTNPTTIRIKVWGDGQAEPASWQYSVTDSTSSLQTAGSVGLRVFLASGATNAPVVFTFDDLLVTPP